MVISILTNSHARQILAPNLSDDSGIESELGAIRSDSSQISQVTSNMAIAGKPAEFDLAEPGRLSEREQLDAIEVRYSFALAEQVEVKRAQATHLEQRLMRQAQQHAERLGKLKQKPPRMLSLPATKRVWRNEVKKESNRLHLAEARLVTVREIRDGMGPLIPRIQEVAAAKLRANNPELARARDEVRRIERAKVQQGKGEGRREQERKTSRSRSLELSRKNA